MGRYASVNCWIIGAPGAQAIIDTGPPDHPTAELWDRAFSAGAVAGVTAIVGTHMHRDHTGQAAALMRRTGASLHMTPQEHAYLAFRCAQPSEQAAAAMQLYLRRLGFDRDTARTIAHVDYSMMADLPDAFQPLHQGQMLNLGGIRWRIRLGGGHSDQAALLLSENEDFLLAGDQVLSGSGPLIAAGPDSMDSDPLADYFAFLSGLSDVPNSTLVLTGHGLPFSAVAQHAVTIRRGHEKRLARLLSGLTGAMTCIELMELIFPSQIHSQVGDILPGVALSMANHLWHAGRIRRHLDDNDVYLFEGR